MPFWPIRMKNDFCNPIVAIYLSESHHDYHHMDKGWFTSPQNKLLNALPPFHFAVRCATLSAVSLRVYCIDKAFAYDKVLNPSRVTRGGERAGRELINERPTTSRVQVQPRGSGSRSGAHSTRQRATPKGFYADRGESDG